MAARQRLTARGYDPKTGATQKQADPYTMNQDRKDPPADAYATGDPDSWAETPAASNTWEAEYQKGRNEVGMGEFLDSTWKDRAHPASGAAPSYDSKTATEALRLAAADKAAQIREAKKLASKALNLTQALFPKAGEKFVMAQARDFMSMAPAALDATLSRIIRAGDEEEEAPAEEPKAEEEKKEASRRVADEAPAEEPKAEEEKKEASKAKKAADPRKRIATLTAQLNAIKVAMEEEGEEEEEGEKKEEKEASIKMIASLEGRLATLRKRLAEEGKEEDQEEEAPAEEEEKKEAGSTQPLRSRRDLASAKPKVAEDEAPAEEEEPKEEEEEGEGKEASSFAELDIDLGNSSLDTVASDGDLLDDIFLAAERTRTASARPQPPKRGVAKLGGTPKTASVADSVSNLSALWKTDPDISGDLG